MASPLLPPVLPAEPQSCLLYSVVISGTHDQTHKQRRRSTDKLDFINIKNSCAANDTILKNQTLLWEKIFAYFICKGLLSRIYKELLKLKSKLRDNPED